MEIFQREGALFFVDYAPTGDPQIELNVDNAGGIGRNGNNACRFNDLMIAAAMET